MRKNKLLLLLLIFILGIPVAYFSFKAVQKLKEESHRKIAWNVLGERIKKEAAEFGADTGIVVEDLASGWKISLNQDKLFPSASLVKVPIMASYILASAKGEVNLNNRIALKNSCRVLGSGTLKSYAPGTEFYINDLIRVMVTESDNTAANMLIDYFGFNRLNSYFKKLGLNNTNLTRQMMDFRKRKQGVENFTSAQDLAALFKEIYNNNLVNKSFSGKCLEILKQQKIKDRIPKRLPAGTVVANKTGLERGVCHDAGIVFTPQGDYLIVVLTRHKNKVARPAKRFIAQLALDVYNYYAYYNNPQASQKLALSRRVTPR